MNPENPVDPRHALEPSLTALLLGELPDDQARFLRQAIATDPELARTFERLKQTTQILHETIMQPAQEPVAPAALLKLSDSRRQELLQRFKTVQPVQFQQKPRRGRSRLVAAAAAFVLMLALSSALLPALSRSKTKSMARLQALEREDLIQPRGLSRGVGVASQASAASNPVNVLSREQRDVVERTLRSGAQEPATAVAQGALPANLADHLGFFQADGRSFQNDNLAAQNTSPSTAEGRRLYRNAGTGKGIVAGAPAAPALSVQQTIVLPAENESAPLTGAVGQDQAAASNRGFDLQTEKPAGMVAFSDSVSPDMSTPLSYAGGFGAGENAPALAQQAPVLGDIPVLGRLFLPQDKGVSGAGPVEAGQSAQNGLLTENEPAAGAPQQSISGSYYGGGAFGGYSVIGKEAQLAAGVAGKMLDSKDRQGQTDLNRADSYSKAAAPNEQAPILRSELRRESEKLSESENAQKLAPITIQGLGEVSFASLPESKEEKPKARDEAAKNELASLGGRVEEFKKQTLVENRVDQEDLGSQKPARTNATAPAEIQTRENPFSTFSLNVSDVSFKLAAASLEQGKLPDPASIRSEEFINAFDYRDPEPSGDQPVAFAWERTRDAFAQNRDLLRFSIKTAATGRQTGKPMNIVLLLDNSGSMERADRVRIIHEALRVLASQLQASDTLSVVAFARTARLWVDGVPGDQAGRVAEELSSLTPQGGTNLEEAMNLAYRTALSHYLANGINRVVLFTDGAANLGDTNPDVLKNTVETNRKQGIALDCFGIGWEDYNDDLLEVLTRNGDGRYGFLNTVEQAATEFATQLAGALHVAASDVKVQVEFNPDRVTAYRQIGYARHQLTKEQFRDNSVDAAEIGAAESGNALYSIETNPQGQGPVAVVRVRYKLPGTADYREHEWTVPYSGNASALEQAGAGMRLAATAGAFSEWLASSAYAAEVTPDRLLECMNGVPAVYGADPRPQKLEWMIRQAKALAGK